MEFMDDLAAIMRNAILNAIGTVIATIIMIIYWLKKTLSRENYK